MNARRSPPPDHARELSAVLQEFGTDLERGLSDAEAQRRLARLGPNQLQCRKQSEFEEFFEIFTEPMFLLRCHGSI